MVLSLDQMLISIGDTYRQHLIHDGLSRLARTRFVIAGKIPGATARTLAATSDDGHEILVSPKLMRQPMDIRRGVLMHELGHAVDFLYPGQIALGRGKARHDLIVSTPDATRRQVAAWARRDHDTVERFADAIAERAFGVTIGYRGPCLLQSTTTGIRPRPTQLR